MRNAEEHAIAGTIIHLMRGVVYRETDEGDWSTLQRSGSAVRDHFATIGVDVVVDETEGYAYLRTHPENDDEEPLPRLVRRRALTYNVSLLLVLLRKRLSEWESAGGEGQLVLDRAQILDMLFSANCGDVPTPGRFAASSITSRCSTGARSTSGCGG